MIPTFHTILKLTTCGEGKPNYLYGKTKTIENTENVLVSENLAVD